MKLKNFFICSFVLTLGLISPVFGMENIAPKTENYNEQLLWGKTVLGIINVVGDVKEAIKPGGYADHHREEIRKSIISILWHVVGATITIAAAVTLLPLTRDYLAQKCLRLPENKLKSAGEKTT